MVQVTCPRCKGGKQNLTHTGACLTCNGVGTISKDKERAIMSIRADLSSKLKDKGIELD